MDKKESLSDLSSKITNSSTEMVVMTDNIGFEQVNALFLKGHKIFGSSNLADLMSKVEICDKSITWYYFGEFESKDVYNLLKVKNIKYLASISNLEVAQKTSNTCEKMSMMRSVFIKVNFGQDSSGCNYEKCLDFYSEVYDHCPYIAKIHY